MLLSIEIYEFLSKQFFREMVLSSPLLLFPVLIGTSFLNWLCHCFLLFNRENIFYWKPDLRDREMGFSLAIILLWKKTKVTVKISHITHLIPNSVKWTSPWEGHIEDCSPHIFWYITSSFFVESKLIFHRFVHINSNWN